MCPRRPNLVLQGCGRPHAEDAWRRVRVGGAEVHVAGPCPRCGVPDVAQALASRGPAHPRYPLRGPIWAGEYRGLAGALLQETSRERACASRQAQARPRSRGGPARLDTGHAPTPLAHMHAPTTLARTAPRLPLTAPRLLLTARSPPSPARGPGDGRARPGGDRADGLAAAVPLPRWAGPLWHLPGPAQPGRERARR